jgi:hypothetical protein
LVRLMRCTGDFPNRRAVRLDPRQAHRASGSSLRGICCSPNR